MENKEYKLSIIVPVYNVEKYIGRCANSLINQTVDVDNYEIIFVDDGTKDKSVEVLKKTFDFERYSNCKIVHKKNGGLSSARNYGVEHSCGEYLWFVDSDDWVEPNAVELIFKLAEESPDIILTSQMFKNIEDKQYLKYTNTISQCLKGVDVLDSFPPSCAVAYICKRTFLDVNSFRFKEGICFEDSELTPKMLYMAHNVVSTDIPIYHHFMREDSITHTISKKSVKDCEVVLKSHVDFYKHVVKKEHQKAYSSNISTKILTALYYSFLAYGKTNKEFDAFVKNNKEIVEMLYLSTHKPTHLYGLLLKFFPSKATLFYYIIKRIKGKSDSL